jgi:diguanylate cyclase (GGDEF)-like protein
MKGNGMELAEYSEIVQYWGNQVLENRGKNAELTLKFCTDIINYGMKNGDDKLMGFGYYYRGETYYCLNDGNRFIEEISQALSCLNKAEEWELMAKCYNFLGIWAINRGNAPIALDYYLNGIGYCSQHHLDKEEAVLNINVGAMNIQCRRYIEAEVYIQKAYNYMKLAQEDPGYHGYMNVIYLNMAKCLLYQNRMEEAGERFRRIYMDHWDYLEESDRLVVYSTEALYYHRLGQNDRRDKSIAQVQQRLNSNMPLLDMSDDLFDYAVLLLEADKAEEFWKMIEMLETMIRNCAIINMQLQLTALKIRFYRKHGQNAEYLQEAGLYYELSEIKEKETQNMIANILNLRKSLESANRVRREVEAQNRILLEKSEVDPLTHIANRSRLSEYAEEIFARSIQTNSSLVVEILDIDYFKEFNDNYGHQAGDGCLRAVAEAIGSEARKHNGFCARYGGDEFVLLYENVSPDQAFSYAAELKERIAQKQIPHAFSKEYSYVTISQGMCWGEPAEGQKVWDYLHTADNMLYRVKTRCRNSYCLGEAAEKDVCRMERD